jgi:hypothetical protein
MVPIPKKITKMVPILRLSLRWHATGTTGSFVIYLEIDTTVDR